MKCPNCTRNLEMTDRNGVEIDYCPDCRGIWLDRGELDKIIERSAENTQTYRQSKDSQQEYTKLDKKHPDYRKKKRDSFLGDLFDF